MAAPVLVGVLDSGLAPALTVFTAASRAFPDGAVAPDRLGHGSALAALVREQAPAARLLNGQIFHDRLATTANAVAEALNWAVGQCAQIVLLSLGLRDDRPVLAHACARAVEQGVLVVASTPARGGLVFPAAYAGVVRASGDARCRPDQVSWFDGCFGACPRAGDDPDQAGASFAAARVAGMLAAGVAAGLTPADAVAVLREKASFVGRERITAPCGKGPVTSQREAS